MFKHSNSNFSHFISWGRTSSGFESLLKSLCFCAQKECQDVILQFHLKNQMNKQSALMNIVPELHKSRDSLLSASAQRYFAGNLHHNAWPPIGLDLIKQTRGSAFFIDSIFSDGWIYFCLKITLFCSWAIENILPVTAASAALCHLFSGMCVEMIPFVNLETCQWHGWEQQGWTWAISQELDPTWI